MPNHIKNKITLSGEVNDIKELVDSLSTFYPSTEEKSYDGRTIYKNDTGEYGWLDTAAGTFSQRDKSDARTVPEGFKVSMSEAWTRMPDFEKVFPCPQSVRDVGDSVSSKIVNLVKNKYNVPHAGNPLLALLEARSRMDDQEVSESERPQFEKACRAFEETGYIYWYDWQNDKWGTKWNAYSCEKLSDAEFTFETAWSGVPDIIMEISRRFPKVKILYNYSDEDTGYNCGQYEFSKGETLSTYIPDGGSVEAYNIAFELRPDWAKNYRLVDGNYVYNDEEEDDE